MNEILEILKEALSGSWGANVGPIEVVVSLGFAVILAIYIYLVYMLMAKKSFYSREFDLALIGVCLITTTLVITIQSSLLVSLSVGGALSIVRFRTAIKSSMDLMFLFWSIAAGIMCGTGVALYALILSVVLTLVILVMMKLPIFDLPQVLIINMKRDPKEEEVLNTVKEYTKRYEVKAKNLSEKILDYTIELRSDRSDELVKKLSEYPFVESVSLLSHDGDTSY